MTSGTRIGILGGTFDPVHAGHVDTALAARRALALDRVLVMPSGTPPHRPSHPSASRFHRFAMTALAVNGLAGLVASDLEIGSTAPSYTFDTLARLHQSGLAASQIFFITGADAFAEIATWSRYPHVLEMAHFVVVSRPGHAASAIASKLPALAARMRSVTVQPTTAAGPRAQAAQVLEVLRQSLEVLLVDAATRDVSSTEIRQRLESRQSISGLVPPAVETYILQHGLYSRSTGSASCGNSLA
jgi:nicotinate-nucleotide adenylyltransferase